MKTKSILLALILIGILTACESEQPSPSSMTGSVNTELTLAPGQSVAISGTELTVTFNAVISDERCPSEVECAVSGPVTVSLSIQQGSDPPTEFTLQTFTDQNGRSPNVEFEGITNRTEVGGYILHLAGVTPYPENLTSKIDASEYRATLLVSNQ